MFTQSKFNKNTLYIFTLFCVMLLDTFSHSILTASFPYFVFNNFASDGNKATMYTSFSLIYSVFAMVSTPIIGYLSDKFNRKITLIYCILGAVLSYTVYCFATNITMFYISRAIAGVSAGSMAVALAYLYDISKSENLYLESMAYSIGLTVAPGLGLILAKYNFFFPAFFMIVFAIVVFLLLLFYLPKDNKENKDNKDNKENVKTKEKLNFFSLINKQYFPLLSFIITVEFSFTLSYSVSYIYLINNLSFTANQLTIYLTVSGISMVIGSAITNKTLKYLGNLKTIIICIIILSVSTSFWLITNNFTILLLISIIDSIAIAIIYTPMHSIMFGSVKENLRGSISGIISSMHNASAVLAPIGVAIMYDYILEELPLIITIAFLLASFIPLYFIRNFAKESVDNEEKIILS